MYFQDHRTPPPPTKITLERGKENLHKNGFSDNLPAADSTSGHMGWLGRLGSSKRDSAKTANQPTNLQVVISFSSNPKFLRFETSGVFAASEPKRRFVFPAHLSVYSDDYPEPFRDSETLGPFSQIKNFLSGTKLNCHRGSENKRNATRPTQTTRNEIQTNFFKGASFRRKSA